MNHQPLYKSTQPFLIFTQASFADHTSINGDDDDDEK